jgi:signal transduction histidine kinase
MPGWSDAGQEVVDTTASDAAATPPVDTPELARIQSPVLGSAAQRLLRDVTHELPGEWDTSLLAGDIARLALALEQDGPPTLAAQNGAESVLLRRVLELLRAEVVALWSRQPVAPAGDAMLTLLGRFETLRVALEPSRNAQFTAQLSSPVGLELVVEIAHDLRSPLTSILFLSEALRRGQSGPINEVQQHQLGIIYSAALGLISIASDVIELARGGDRLAEREPSSFSMREIFDAVGDVVRPMAEEKGLALRLVSGLDADQRMGYPVALSRVLLNLTTNALKFTETGSVDLVAELRGDGRVELGVADTGPGISDDVVRQLYEPFRYIPNRGGYDFSESGLGLSICRKLVQAMGAELCFETDRERGTRFWFALDLQPSG